MGFELRPGIRRLFRLPLRSPPAMHADVDEELASLIAARTESLIARGYAPSAARDEALRRLGASVDSVREQLHQSVTTRERRMRFHEHLENLVQDVRYAARGLARRPGFTIVATLTLAIGIGATTAIFSAVNVLLLRPLPYAKPDELMSVSLVAPANGDRPMNDHMVWSYPKFVVFRDAQRVFSDEAVYAPNQFVVTSGDVERVRGELVGAAYLRTLGLSPVRGRDFERSEDANFGAPKQAIISYAFWQRRFNADPAAIGATIDFDHDPYVIIGVGPQTFRGLTGQAEVFIPLLTGVADDWGPYSHGLSLVGRLRPGVTASQATAAAAVIGPIINDAYPNTATKAKWTATARPLNSGRVSPIIERSLLVVFAAVGLVLLIACVNVANLLLGRASARRREIAVRLAVGAGRSRLVRLLLTESLLLSGVGGTASLFVAWAGVHALGKVNPATTLRGVGGGGLGAVAFSAISLDWTALAFALSVTLVVGALFGIVPAMSATRASLTSALKDGHAGTRFGIGTDGGRRLLVMAEVALALVLLAGSGLMVRSLSKLLSTSVGFTATGVLTARLTVPQGSVPRDSLPSFYIQLLDRIRAVPGVVDASLNNCAPLSGGCNGTRMRLLDNPGIDLTHSPSVGVHWASPTWFSTMRIPLKRGRYFTNADRADAQRVVIINEAAAREIWPNEDPIGKHVEVGQGGIKDAEIIGIVGGVRQRADSAAGADVYAPYLQSPMPGMVIFIRTSRDPASIGGEVRAAIHEVAPAYPLYDMQTMTDRAAAATAQARFSAMLLAFFAVTALSLAAIGIYGVMSLAVTARTREIGIRIALGADRGRVQRLVVGEGAALVAVGASVGLVGALFATRVLRNLLFDVGPSDPVTYVSIVFVLGAAALLASWIPARRAGRVDPLTALRAD
jgi:predicted permease